MANSATPTTQSRRQPSIPFILMLGLSLALLVIGADAVFPALRPLDQLGIPYPHVFCFIPFLLPAMVILVWFISRRSVVATGVALVLAVCVMTAATHWADAPLARIPLANWMEGTELRAAEQRLGFKIAETGIRDGSFLLVDRGNEKAATNEVKRLRFYRQ